jgi:hypothetical protein
MGTSIMRAAALTPGTALSNNDLLHLVGNYGDQQTHYGATTHIIFINPSPLGYNQSHVKGEDGQFMPTTRIDYIS